MPSLSLTFFFQISSDYALFLQNHHNPTFRSPKSSSRSPFLHRTSHQTTCPTRKRGVGGFYYLGTHTNDHKIVVRFPNKKEFKDDLFWTTGLFSINTTKFQIIPITTRPVPTPEIEKRHMILLGLPYGLRVADFLLHENNLKFCALLGKEQSTNDFKVPKFLDWKQVPVPADEEDKDNVAGNHYMKNMTPWEV
uniref:Uncharacterized protein n=1 Tax=Cannabis sativa TaxID=3483 RepID=A0A803QGA5_CANSA